MKSNGGQFDGLLSGYTNGLHRTRLRKSVALRGEKILRTGWFCCVRVDGPVLVHRSCRVKCRARSERCNCMQGGRLLSAYTTCLLASAAYVSLYRECARARKYRRRMCRERGFTSLCAINCNGASAIATLARRRWSHPTLESNVRFV